jgi:hypothetical protein
MPAAFQWKLRLECKMVLFFILCFFGVVSLGYILVASERDLRSRQTNSINDEWVYPATPLRLKKRLKQNYRQRMQLLDSPPKNLVEFSRQGRVR